MRTPRTGQCVISPKELSPSWVMLYAATFVLQLPCAAIRALVAYPVLGVAFRLAGPFIGEYPGHIHTFALIIAYGPFALSLATLILPLGGWWWEQQAGGRAPSERERLIYDDAITQLRQANPSLRKPRRWFVIDEEQENAAAFADTVMVSRGLLDSGYLQAVLAHELGHVNSSDARLTAALYRITTPPRREVHRGLKTICFFATGAAGMWPLRAAWGAYWRGREHHADQYAASLGQADMLGEFLNERRALIDLPVPFMWLSDQSHPPTEHRIEHLARGATHHAPSVHTPSTTYQSSQPRSTRRPMNKPENYPRGRPSSDRIYRTNTPSEEVANRSEPVKETPTGPPTAGPDGLPLTEP